MNKVKFRSDMTVQNIDYMGGDDAVIQAMLVSTDDALLADEMLQQKTIYGRINFLMKNRHGCYDSLTEVYTDEGWKAWPDVRGDELFLTLSANEQIEYQKATHLVRKPVVDEPMVRIQMAQIDLLVTADHNMLAKRRRQINQERWELVPAKDLLQASHRLRLGGGNWQSTPNVDLARMHLLGFFIGDGYSDGGTPTFHLRKNREIKYLLHWAEQAGFNVTQTGDRYYLRADSDFRLLAKKCYAMDGSKIVPDEILLYDTNSHVALLDGLMNSDGTTSDTGKQTYSTTSVLLAGQVQIVALKAGRAAIVNPHPFTNDDGHYGTKSRFRVTIYRQRNSQPRVGWTVTARSQQVSVESYTGDIHCVTVPNGTLYVRRNGKALWCGNTPFEHAALKFFVEAPLVVFREWHRHRIGWSYNERSGRYSQLDPVYYIPAENRPFIQIGKPGAYSFIPGDYKTYTWLVQDMKEEAISNYAHYEARLERGIAKEMARFSLGVNIYSAMFATCNPRSLMAFLSLRTKEEDSHFPSYPMWEIELCARAAEETLNKLFPMVYQSFNENGRVCP